jgi:hypothetical protein
MKAGCINQNLYIARKHFGMEQVTLYLWLAVIERGDDWRVGYQDRLGYLRRAFAVYAVEQVLQCWETGEEYHEALPSYSVNRSRPLALIFVQVRRS